MFGMKSCVGFTTSKPNTKLRCCMNEKNNKKQFFIDNEPRNCISKSNYLHTKWCSHSPQLIITQVEILKRNYGNPHLFIRMKELKVHSYVLAWSIVCLHHFTYFAFSDNWCRKLLLFQPLSSLFIQIIFCIPLPLNQDAELHWYIILPIVFSHI